MGTASSDDLDGGLRGDLVAVTTGGVLVPAVIFGSGLDGPSVLLLEVTPRPPKLTLLTLTLLTPAAAAADEFWREGEEEASLWPRAAAHRPWR